MDSIADLGTLDRLSVMSCLVSAVLYLYKQGLQIENISKKNEVFSYVIVIQLVKLDIIVNTKKSHPEADGINN